jgi:HAD superfamily hydrolase (TIGR01490 family)
MIAAPQSQPKHSGNKLQQLVLFDFDGTITTKDTLAEFMIFYHGKLRYVAGLALLSPFIAAYIFKLMPNWKSKQYFLAHFLKNQSLEIFEKRCREFSEKHLPALIRPGALEAIRQYKKNGATIAVVSASAENWVKPWCDQNGILCLSTKLEVKDNKITGKILGKNCHGPEKVCRIKDKFDLSQFSEVIAYGDTSGDKEMLALAHKSHYKPFRNK